MNAILKPLPKTHNRYKSVLERIEANVAYCWPANPGPDWDGTPCELWLGGRNGSGYGRMCIRAKSGKQKGKPRNKAVHRLVLKEHGEPIQRKTKEVMHLCNEKLCTAKSHLRLGTKSDNTLYQVLSGTHNSIKSATREPGED